MQTYDFIFAGGGVAGLSLAYHLARSPLAGRRVLIIDQEPHACEQRTLSFWSEWPPPYASIVWRSWERLRLVAPGFQKEACLRQYGYHTIRGQDFAQYTRATATAAGATFLSGRVTAIEENGNGAVVRVGDDLYRGRWVFDSRFDRAKFARERTRDCDCCLWQCFQGWEILTATDCFEAGTATLMDFRASQQGEWRFFYVLPYTPRHALVELVSLSPERNGDALHAYIGGVLGITQYEIVAREGGATPLTTYDFPRRLGNRVMSIGTSGGRIKPSTGYGFTRMEADAQAIVRSLLERGHPFALPADSAGYRRLDNVMLRTLSAHETWALPLFRALIRHNPPERILRFLDERIHPFEAACLFASLLPETVARFAFG